MKTAYFDIETVVVKPADRYSNDKYQYINDTIVGISLIFSVGKVCKKMIY